jgi:[ribosomal protein S18]-alanine N-acetyltransferase
MPWKVEPLVPGRDLDEVVEIEKRCFTNPWTREMFMGELERGDVVRAYVARTAEWTVAGYCSAWLVADELHINNLAVRPECRSGGVGRALVEHALDAAFREGARRATLEVRRSNAAALRLYERLGFKASGVRRGYYTKPREDALILWLELAPRAGLESP